VILNPLTTEWVAKAEGDLASALREWRARKAPNYDAACFHAQQCAEKYFKALLQENSIAFGKTHNLVALLNLLLSVEPTWSTLEQNLRTLTEYAVDFRYPGAYATKQNAGDAIAICCDVRQRVRVSLGLIP